MQTYPRRLKTIRTYFGLTQTELAQQVGLTQAVLSAIEAGRILPAYHIQQNINAAFNLDLNQPIVIPVTGKPFNLITQPPASPQPVLA